MSTPDAPPSSSHDRRAVSVSRGGVAFSLSHAHIATLATTLAILWQLGPAFAALATLPTANRELVATVRELAGVVATLKTDAAVTRRDIDELRQRVGSLETIHRNASGATQ